jgi:regulator of RNase E activity RraA
MNTTPIAETVFDGLRNMDTPTICNGIERALGHPTVEGFTDMGIRALFPELGYMLGYAVTVQADASTPGAPFCWEGLWQMYEAVQASPKPAVLVMQDVGPAPLRSAHAGEVMVTLCQRLGAIGAVTDGGFRDIKEVQALGFHYFARGTVASHGNCRILGAGMPVQVGGMKVNPGDLIHGDANGLVNIPLALAAKVLEECQNVRKREADIMAHIRGPEFTLDGLKQRIDPRQR